MDKHYIFSAPGRTEIGGDHTDDDFYTALPDIRREVSDRAILRAIHIYQENKRVVRQVEAIKRGDMDAFLQLLKESGRSSWMGSGSLYSSGPDPR